MCELGTYYNIHVGNEQCQTEADIIDSLLASLYL